MIKDTKYKLKNKKFKPKTQKKNKTKVLIIM